MDKGFNLKSQCKQYKNVQNIRSKLSLRTEKIQRVKEMGLYEKDVETRFLEKARKTRKYGFLWSTKALHNSNLFIQFV